ncbi:MAG: ribonuclease HII [Gemmatimonadaceae bacterium]
MELGGDKRRSRAVPSRWTSIERELRRSGGPLIAGVDEVGRGSLAGPVVACAVIMPHDVPAIRGVDDSKLLSARERVKLAGRIRERALDLALGAASAREIDRINIYQATILAMRRALRRLRLSPDHVLIDGRPLRTLGISHRAVIGGDARCFCIACASIVAKVTRDRIMHALAPRYPEYCWDRNVGYGTRDHQAGLASRGLAPHHRRSFTSHAQLWLDFEVDPSVSAEMVQELIEEALTPPSGHDQPSELAPADAI